VLKFILVVAIDAPVLSQRIAQAKVSQVYYVITVCCALTSMLTGSQQMRKQSEFLVRRRVASNRSHCNTAPVDVAWIPTIRHSHLHIFLPRVHVSTRHNAAACCSQLRSVDYTAALSSDTSTQADALLRGANKSACCKNFNVNVSVILAHQQQLPYS
jgi:hypothetical protein